MNDIETESAMDGRFAKQLKWLGIALIVLGALAIVFPLATTIAAKVFIGWLFLFGGAFQIWQSFSIREWGGFLWNLLIGAMYFLVGGWLAFDPFAGIIGLTVLLAMTFIAQGVMEAAIAYKLRPEEGWGWMMFSGLIGVLAGVMLISGLPSTATWAVGLMVGINMISSGFAFFTLGSVGKKIVDNS